MNKTLERTNELSDNLKQKLSTPLKLTVQSDSAMKKLNDLQTKLKQMKDAEMNIKLNTSSVNRDTSKLRKQIGKSLSEKPFEIGVEATSATPANQKSSTASKLINIFGTIGPLVSGIGGVYKLVTAISAGGGLKGTLASLAGGGAAGAALGATAVGGLAVAGGAAAAGGVTTAGASAGAKGLAGVQTLLSGVTSAYNAIAPIFKSSVGQAMNQQETVDRFAVAAGSDTGGQAIFDAVSKQALASNYAPQEAQQSAMELVRVTTDPAQLTALNGLAMRMQKLNPSGSLADSAASLKEFMGGDASALLAGMGLTDKQLQDSGASAAVASGDMDSFLRSMDSLLSGQGMSEADFGKLTQTPAGKMEGLQQRAQFQFGQAGMPAMETLIPVMDKLMAAFDSGKFEPFFNMLSAGLMLVAKLISAAADAVLFLMDLFSSNGDVITNVLTVLVTMLLPLMAFLLWSMIAPIVMIAAAWLMANWPILLVIAAIGLLVYWLLQTGTSAGQIIGFIVGAFYYLGASIYNMIAVVWNLFATFAEFLINLFVDPVYAIQKLFYDLAMLFGDNLYQMLLAAETFAGGFMKVILQAVNGIIGGVNKLMSGISKVFNIDIKAIQELDTDNLNVLSDSLKGMMDGIEPPTSSKDTIKIPRLGSKNAAAAFGEGYKDGNALTKDFTETLKGKDESLKDKFKGEDDFNGKGGGMEEKTKNMMNGMGGTSPGGNIGNIGNIDKVGEVGSIGEEVDIGSEDLKVMRDLAEMKAIQNFVTLTPTVQVTTGPVSSQVDVDDVVRKITGTMKQEIESSAQGVYGF
ncbi:hypothetical protein SAMN05444162_3591 [Paenibacillaceae bacterium GAS479]|nr:hypothetical protein SAMN05444162_3591 [Paenibacillaceae bacterium GAS479]